MTTSIVKIERTSGSIGRPSVAPGPSGGTYFAEGSNSTGVAHVARLDSAGALVWTKEITISAATTANGVTPTIYSSSDHVAVVLRYFETAGSVYKTSVVLYQSDGTLVWEKTVPVAIEHRPSIEDNITTDAGVTGLVLAEDESVYLTGMVSSNTQLALVKLNGSDGSLAWVVNL
jgi:outer membrane protein assembly factor BamB